MHVPTHSVAQGLPAIHNIPLDRIDVRPDLFQARDTNAGQSFDDERVRQIVDNWNPERFDPLSVVANPDAPGRYIVIGGHHRLEAVRRLDIEQVPVRALAGDIGDPEDRRRLEREAVISNFGVAESNLRERVNAAGRLADSGLDTAEVARDMRMKRNEAERLLWLRRLPPGVIERVMVQPELAVAAAELGRSMERHGMEAETVHGLFTRWIKDYEESGQVPGQYVLRQQLDTLAETSRGPAGDQAGFAGLAGFGGDVTLAKFEQERQKAEDLQRSARGTQQRLTSCESLAAELGIDIESVKQAAETKLDLLTAEQEASVRRTLTLHRAEVTGEAVELAPEAPRADGHTPSMFDSPKGGGDTPPPEPVEAQERPKAVEQAPEAPTPSMFDFPKGDGAAPPPEPTEAPETPEAVGQAPEAPRAEAHTPSMFEVPEEDEKTPPPEPAQAPETQETGAREAPKNEVSSTILDQLSLAPPGEGRGRLTAMVGAWLFAEGEDYTAFQFKGSRKWKGVVIELQPDDTYEMRFWRLSPTKGLLDKTMTGLHAGDLEGVFKSETGLDTHLGAGSSGRGTQGVRMEKPPLSELPSSLQTQPAPKGESSEASEPCVVCGTPVDTLNATTEPGDGKGQFVDLNDRGGWFCHADYRLLHGLASALDSKRTGEPAQFYTGDVINYRGQNIAEVEVTFPGQAPVTGWETTRRRDGATGRFQTVEDAQRWLRMRRPEAPGGREALPAGTPASRGFTLPSGHVVPNGKYPRVVQWPQGGVDIRYYTRTGTHCVIPRKTPSTETPLEGFRVLGLTKKPPVAQVRRLGGVNMEISSTGMSFRPASKGTGAAATVTREEGPKRQRQPDYQEQCDRQYEAPTSFLERRKRMPYERR